MRRSVHDVGSKYLYTKTYLKVEDPACTEVEFRVRADGDLKTLWSTSYTAAERDGSRSGRNSVDFPARSE